MADKQGSTRRKQPKDTKSFTFLSASKTGFVATNAKRVRQWKRG